MKSILAYYAEFRSRVPFDKEIWNDAKKVFDHLNFMHNCSRETNCTSVVVHMRMGDYMQHLKSLNLGPDLFNNTNYLQNAFKNVTKTCKVKKTCGMLNYSEVFPYKIVNIFELIRSCEQIDSRFWY